MEKERKERLEWLLIQYGQLFRANDQQSCAITVEQVEDFIAAEVATGVAAFQAELREREDEANRLDTEANQLVEKLVAAREESRKFGRAMAFHRCKNGEIKPYPCLLCSAGCSGTDFNVLAALRASSDDAGRNERLRAGKGSWCPSCKGHLLDGDHFDGRACGTCHGPTINLVAALAAMRDLHERWMRVIRGLCIDFDISGYDDLPGKWDELVRARLAACTKREG